MEEFHSFPVTVSPLRGTCSVRGPVPPTWHSPFLHALQRRTGAPQGKSTAKARKMLHS